MYRKDDTSYFIVDAHVALWDARPENQRNVHGKQFIDCFYDYHRNLSPESEVWSYEEYLYQGGERLMKDLFDDGYVDHAIFQPAQLGEFYYKGFGQTDEAFGLASQHPDKLTYNHNFDPRNGEAGLYQFREDASEVQPQGGQALHRRVARRVPWLASRRPVGIPLLRGMPRTRHPQHPRAQRPDDPAAGPRRVRRRRRRPRGVGLHRPELRRRALRPAAAGGLLLDRDAGTQRARRSRGGDAVHPHPAEVLRADHGRAPVLGRRRPHPVLLRLRAVDAAMAVEAFVDFQIPDELSEYAPITTEQKKKILGLNAAKMYDIPVPAELQLPAADEPAVGPRGADNLVGA